MSTRWGIPRERGVYRRWSKGIQTTALNGDPVDGVTKQSRRVVTPIRSIQVLHTYSEVRSLHDGCQHCRCSWIARWSSMAPRSVQHRQSGEDDCLRIVTVMDGKTGDESKRHMHLRAIGTQAYVVTKQSRRAVSLIRSLKMSHHDGSQHCRRSSIYEWS